MAGRKAQVIELGESKIRQPSGLKKDGTPNAYWRRFQIKLKKHSEVKVEDWKEEHVLGYLLERYADHYGVEWSFAYSGAPTKCSEMYCIRRMITTLGSQDDQTMSKEYIDWVFDSKIKRQNIQLRSLGFFFTRHLCNEFKAGQRTRKRITRSTELPLFCVTAGHEVGLDLRTYGDLAFAKLALVQGQDRAELAPYRSLFESLKGMGFNENVLEGLE